MLSAPEATPAAPPPAVTRRVGESALRHAKHFRKHTKLDTTQGQNVPKLSWSDVMVGQILGQGGFSEVHAVSIRRRGFEPKKLDFSDSSSSDDCSTADESSCFSAEPEQEYDYAIKFLKPSVVSNEKTFRSGAIDLVMEVKILSLLRHENIISLHGVSGKFVSEAYLENGHGYFLIMDRLHDTVDERIKEWKKQKQDCCWRPRSRPIFWSPMKQLGGVSTLHPEQKQALRDRLETVALPVARAMQYLHENNIIYRDLKPSNIGFDRDGTIKIFDFGLAREIIHPDRRMTGNTGSLRYMSPEVARREHYGLPADVYSFSILLWELCSLDRPYGNMTRDMFTEHVVFGGVRPHVESAWSSNLQKLLRQSWDHDPKLRPTFETVCEKVQNEVSHKSDRLTSSRHKVSSRLRSWTQKDSHNNRSRALAAE